MESTGSKGGETIFASPAVGGPRRRCEADLGALGELDPRRARTSAMLRRDSARRALREAAERPAAQILRRQKIRKIKLGQMLICFVVTRARQARPAAGRRLRARLLARRAATSASRGCRRRSVGRREPSQGARCRAVCETAKMMRDGVRDARRAVVRGARGRALDRGGGAVSPAPLWWKAWGEERRQCGRTWR